MVLVQRLDRVPARWKLDFAWAAKDGQLSYKWARDHMGNVGKVDNDSRFL